MEPATREMWMQLARASVWVSVGVVVFCQVVCSDPGGGDALLLVAAAVLAVPGLFLPKLSYKVGSAALVIGCLALSVTSYHTGRDHEEQQSRGRARHEQHRRVSGPAQEPRQTGKQDHNESHNKAPDGDPASP